MKDFSQQGLGKNKKYEADIKKIEKAIEKTKDSDKTISFEQKIENINKYTEQKQYLLARLFI